MNPFSSFYNKKKAPDLEKGDANLVRDTRPTAEYRRRSAVSSLLCCETECSPEEFMKALSTGDT